MKKIIFLITVFLGVSLAGNAQIDKRVIFNRGENGVHTYRIPALVQAKDGTLLAFAEARWNSASDTGNIDLVLKRSTDGGRTWGPVITVWDNGENVCGNPSPVVDRESGRIILLSTWNKGTDHERDIHRRTSEDSRRVFVLFSDDNGLSWSAPREITAQTKREDWTWYATGPCHAIQLRSGRLVVPCDHSVFKDGKDAGSHSHIIYSDDLGENWRIGGDCPVGNESTIVELDNGDLLLNMRGQRKNREDHGYARLAAISHDGGETLEPYFHAKGLIEPVCNASIIDYSPAGKRSGIILFSNPEHISKRLNMTVRMSKDGGSSWKRIFTLAEGPSAYSDLCVLSKGQLAVLYETGQENPYETITLGLIGKKALKKAFRK